MDNDILWTELWRKLGKYAAIAAVLMTATCESNKTAQDYIRLNHSCTTVYTQGRINYTVTP